MKTESFQKTSSCSGCPIRHRAVCASCEADELAELESLKYYRSFDAGQPIAFSGDAPDFVGTVVAGTAMLNRTLEDGRRQMVGLLQPGDFLGQPGRHVLSYDVTAATPVTMCCFRRKPFEAMALRTPHICHRILEMTLDELDASREWMLLLGRKTARERIASFIAIIAQRARALLEEDKTGTPISPRTESRGVSGQKVVLDLPLTREAIADYLGLTIETVSRQVSALRRDGVILLEGQRHVTVPDLGRLLRETGDAEGI